MVQRHDDKSSARGIKIRNEPFVTVIICRGCCADELLINMTGEGDEADMTCAKIRARCHKAVQSRAKHESEHRAAPTAVDEGTAVTLDE